MRGLRYWSLAGAPSAVARLLKRTPCASERWISDVETARELLE